MPQNDFDLKIDQSWERLRQSHAALYGVTVILEEKIEDSVDSGNFKNSDSTFINLSESLPLLSARINDFPDSQLIQQELKQLIMKTYWDGFYNGKNTTLD